MILKKFGILAILVCVVWMAATVGRLATQSLSVAQMTSSMGASANRSVVQMAAAWEIGYLICCIDVNHNRNLKVGKVGNHYDINSPFVIPSRESPKLKLALVSKLQSMTEMSTVSTSAGSVLGRNTTKWFGNLFLAMNFCPSVGVHMMCAGRFHVWLLPVGKMSFSSQDGDCALAPYSG